MAFVGVALDQEVQAVLQTMHPVRLSWMASLAVIQVELEALVMTDGAKEMAELAVILDQEAQVEVPIGKQMAILVTDFREPGEGEAEVEDIMAIKWRMGVELGSTESARAAQVVSP